MVTIGLNSWSNCVCLLAKFSNHKQLWTIPGRKNALCAGWGLIFHFSRLKGDWLP